MAKSFLLDGRPVEYGKLIDAAKNIGYEGDAAGIYTTSGAAEVLRRNGHTVEQNEPPRPVPTKS